MDRPAVWQRETSAMPALWLRPALTPTGDDESTQKGATPIA